MTLVALFAMTAGAWADDSFEEFDTNTKVSVYTGEHFKITPQNTGDDDGFPLNTGYSATIEALNGEIITKVEFTKGYYEINRFHCEVGTTTISDDVATVSGVNATSLTVNATDALQIKAVKVYYTPAPTGPEVTKTEGKTNEWTFTMPAGNVELQVEYYPAMLTLAASPADGGKVELDAAAAPVEWTPETWTNVSTTGQHGDLTSGDITLTATGGWLTKQEDGNLSLYSADNEYDHQTLTFSTTGDGFTRIELTMTSDASNHNPHITPADGWTFSGKSAVWEGEATKSLVCQNCTTTVSKITFYRGSGLPTGVEKDETGNIYVKSGTTVTVKATPEEGYHLVSLSDGTNTYDVDADGIATITMPEGDADLTLTATFSDQYELTFDDVNFKTNQNITVKVGDADKTLDQDGKLSVKAGQTVTLTAKQGYKFRTAEAKKTVNLLTITISGVTVYYAEGDSWANAISRDENKDSGLFIREGNRVHHSNYGQLVDSNTEAVLPEAIINANESYRFIK